MTWPDPELLAGADEPCRPLLAELPEFGELAELPELPELAELAECDELPAAEPPDPAELVLRLLCWDVVACAEPGRQSATPAAVSMLARPAAAVTARSRAWCRSRAAACCVRFAGRAGAGSGVIGCLPWWADAPSLACLVL